MALVVDLEVDRRTAAQRRAGDDRDGTDGAFPILRGCNAIAGTHEIPAGRPGRRSAYRRLRQTLADESSQGRGINLEEQASTTGPTEASRLPNQWLRDLQVLAARDGRPKRHERILIKPALIRIATVSFALGFLRLLNLVLNAVDPLHLR